MDGLWFLIAVFSSALAIIVLIVAVYISRNCCMANPPHNSVEETTLSEVDAESCVEQCRVSDVVAPAHLWNGVRFADNKTGERGHNDVRSSPLRQSLFLNKPEARSTVAFRAELFVAREGYPTLDLGFDPAKPL